LDYNNLLSYNIFMEIQFTQEELDQIQEVQKKYPKRTFNNR